MNYDDLPEVDAAMVRMTGITLVRTTQTAWACPAQWDAWDAKGNYYYLRYRSGYGQVRQYASPDWADAPWLEVDQSEPGWALRANPEYIGTVATFEYGHPLDGAIGLREFCALAGLRLSPELIKTSLGQHFADELILRGVPMEAADAITEPWKDISD